MAKGKEFRRCRLRVFTFIHATKVLSFPRTGVGAHSQRSSVAKRDAGASPLHSHAGAWERC
ncbi:MAG: hypothetical protein WAW41_11105 [Methylobacter sp.]